ATRIAGGPPARGTDRHERVARGTSSLMPVEAAAEIRGGAVSFRVPSGGPERGAARRGGGGDPGRRGELPRPQRRPRRAARLLSLVPRADRLVADARSARAVAHRVRA